MVVAPGNHQGSDSQRSPRHASRDKLGTGGTREARGRPASGSQSPWLGEKDGHIRARSRWLVHPAGSQWKTKLNSERICYSFRREMEDELGLPAFNFPFLKRDSCAKPGDEDRPSGAD
ncbi:MAG: hypothetical protein H6Q86_2537 [candidate division NC10 bacterium]|jgi:hypothetical protein|nr:hypothetical protein [candidate division NC10 bacterium]